MDLPDFLVTSRDRKLARVERLAKLGINVPLPPLDSSDAKWLPEFKDTIESKDLDFVVDSLDDSVPNPPGLEELCLRPQSFRPVPVDEKQLKTYYRKASWSLACVNFVLPRNNFTGPTSGLKCPKPQGVPLPHTVFELYSSGLVMDRIVVETNIYATTLVPVGENKDPKTKEGCMWRNVNHYEIRGWNGICILMGYKRLPSVR